MTLHARDQLLSHLAGVEWPFGPLLAQLNLDTDADVLDLGAGEGRLLSALRAGGHQGRTLGVDPAPGPSVIQARAEALPFPAASFDMALLVRVLAHLPKPSAALSEARRVLRPGGQLVVAAHGPAHLHRLWQALGQGNGRPSHGAADKTPRAQVLDFYLPVTLIREVAVALAGSYRITAPERPGRFPLRDTLHLRTEWR